MAVLLLIPVPPKSPYNSLIPCRMATASQYFPVNYLLQKSLICKQKTKVTLTNVSEIDDKMDITILSPKELRV